jgi:cytochrome oxidase Cu insertion factor (SCO1/SenC/PrrC family)
MWAGLAVLLVSWLPGTLSPGDSLPPVTLIDQDGVRVRIDALGGRSVLLSFVSTRQASPTFCPAVTAKFLYLQQHLPASGYRLVQITRDSAVDSPLRMRRYADEFGAHSSDWRFLTGSPADITRLIASLGAGSAADGYEKLYLVSGRGELLGDLPADDWSPVDALAWAATIDGALPGETATYSGQSATTSEPAFQAKLVLQGKGLKRRLDLIEFDRSPQEPIRSFITDMTKLLHLVVVSDDLRDFQHVHPVLGPDGHFRLAIAFPRPALYHIYADATPQGHGHAVFRFDAAIGDVRPAARPATVSGETAHAGPYTVRLSAVSVPARQDVPLIIAVQRGAGLPAVDLHPYLGAYAHVVAVDIADLSYMHAHPMTPGAMDMAGTGAMGAPLPDSAPVPATMTVHLDFPRPGLYRIWIQFRGGTGLYAAPFVVQAT